MEIYGRVAPRGVLRARQAALPPLNRNVNGYDIYYEIVLHIFLGERMFTRHPHQLHLPHTQPARSHNVEDITAGG